MLASTCAHVAGIYDWLYDTGPAVLKYARWTKRQMYRRFAKSDTARRAFREMCIIKNSLIRPPRCFIAKFLHRNTANARTLQG